MKNIAGVAWLLASLAMGHSAEQPTKPSREMNELIRSVHAELLELKASVSWLADYDEACLWESEGRNMIHYSPKEREQAGPAPQQPDHFSLEYIPIDFDKKKRLKYSNTFEGIAVCEFPALHLKIYGEVLVWEDRRLEERLKQLVITKCRRNKLQEPSTKHQRNSKPQIPNPKQIPSSNFQNDARLSFADLEVEICDFIGVWSLGFGIFHSPFPPAHLGGCSS